VEAQADLAQVVGALDPVGRIPRFLNSGQEQRQEHTDDGNDNQEFKERETSASATHGNPLGSR
jgi:hypothetical protein